MKKDLVIRMCRFIAGSVFLLFLVVGSLHAQQTGVLTGTVQDPRGSVLPNAVVVVKNDSTGSTKQTKSDLQGRFSVAGLAAGKYSVEVSATGV